MASSVNEHGMIVDFAHIKEVIMKYDHENLNRMDEFKELAPTAENVARVIAYYTQEKLDLEMNKPVCYAVDVWETPNNKVRWEMDEAKDEAKSI